MPDFEYMEKMQKDILDLMQLWCTENDKLSASAIGGILMATALKVYRSSMSDEDYNGIIDMISNSRNAVVPFNFVDKSKLN